MTTFTREWLQQTIADFESTRDDAPFGLDEDDAKILAALKLALAAMQQEPVVVPDDQHAVTYHDNRSRVFVLEQRGNRRQFTYEEWKVICMAANSDMENRLHTLGHAMALRQQRWEDERERLQHRIVVAH